MLRINCTTSFGSFVYPERPLAEKITTLFLNLKKYRYVVKKEDIDNGKIHFLEDFRRGDSLESVRINIEDGVYIARIDNDELNGVGYTDLANHEIVPHDILVRSKYRELEIANSYIFARPDIQVWVRSNETNLDYVEGGKVILDYSTNYGTGRTFQSESYDKTVNELFKSGSDLHKLLNISAIKNCFLDNQAGGWLSINIGSSYWCDTGTSYYVLEDKILVKDGINRNSLNHSLVGVDFFADVYVSVNRWGINVYVKSIKVLLDSLTDVVNPIIIKDKDVVEFTNTYYGSGPWDDLKATEAWLAFINKHVKGDNLNNKFIVMGDVLLAYPKDDEGGFSYSMLYSLNATDRILDQLDQKVKDIVTAQNDRLF